MCTINKSVHTKKSLETYRMHLIYIYIYIYIYEKKYGLKSDSKQPVVEAPVMQDLEGIYSTQSLSSLPGTL